MKRSVTDLALVLLAVFARDVRTRITIRELSILAGKPYANVHATVKVLLERNILAKDVVGHSHSCRLDFSTPETALCLALAQSRNAENTKRDRNVLLVWEHEGKQTIVTRTAAKGSITLAALIADKELFSTIGAQKLRYGHAFYAQLLTEVLG